MIGAGALVGTLVIGFGLTAVDLGSYKFWAPKYENVRRQVFVQTDSFVEGKISFLTNLELQYKQAQTEESRAGLRTTILLEAAQVNPSQLPVQLQAFIQSLQ